MNLVIKDIVSQQKYLLFILGLFILFSYVGGFGLFYLGVGLMMLAMRLAYLEEKNNALLFLRTMPLKPAAIVLSKYLSVLILALVFAGLGIAKLYLFHETDLENVLSLLTVLSTMLIFSGVFILLYFKMGYMKASTYFRVIFLSLFVLIFAGNSALDQFKPMLTRFFEAIPINLTSLLVAVLVILAIYLVLAAVTVWIFQRQEVFTS